MICWDEEFVEDIQITNEILMNSKWDIKEADSKKCSTIVEFKFKQRLWNQDCWSCMAMTLGMFIMVFSCYHV